MRLDRFVSQAAGVSRSQARSLIQRGHVRVGGEPVRDVSRQIGSGERVEHLGGRLELPRQAYLMLNKPLGLLSATSDSRQATVLALLPEALSKRVHLVGRLDKETTGLLLLTDDGGWSHREASPNHGCAKTYLAELAHPLAEGAESRLQQGLLLRSEKTLTRAATLQRIDETRVRITITEGRYHQVRRMFAALGNRVVGLHRESIGGLSLDPSLQPGEWRELSVAERAAALQE
ncbi:MAG: pseudouridine synthase [Sedimenticolaceae bacterium]